MSRIGSLKATLLPAGDFAGGGGGQLLHDVEHALQCGYCTPGMLVTSRDIVLRLPNADEARVREELAGNLCRCTGYRGIVRAVLSVLAERRKA